MTSAAVLQMLLVASSITGILGFQKIFNGEETILDLPLQNPEGINTAMELKYWTMLKETKDCVLAPYECNLDEYETIF
jgi:hypothetical protein